MSPKEQEQIKEDNLKQGTSETMTSQETGGTTTCEKEASRNGSDDTQKKKLNQQEPSEKEENQEGKAEEKKVLSEEEKLIQEVEAAQKEAENWKDKYLRLSAEFDNYRKRTMKEKAELILNGSEKSISSILPVVDDLERAIKNMETASELAPIKEGIDLIYNKFLSILGQNGVKVIETKEKTLDTDYHEAIAVIPAPNDTLKGKILDCVQTGYTLNDRVMRHAKVVVGE
ncbi:MAG: nucleotide exchange factor GrpE [Bacteroides sp.]|nr:nucleotide exchange factor GrpE [Bacteroides sp.]